MPALVPAADGTLLSYDWLPGDHPVLLIHGFATTAELTWRTSGVVRALTDAGHGVVMADLRGHGASDKPHEPEQYSPAILAKDALAVLDDIGLARVDVVAYSMGCRVAWALTANSSQRIDRLVLAGVGTREMLQTWGVNSVRELLLHGVPMHDETDTKLITGAMTVPGTDIDSLLAVVAGMSGGEIRGASPVPTLVIAGDSDHLAQDADALADTIGARFVSVAKRTHLNLLGSRAFKQALVDFLG